MSKSAHQLAAAHVPPALTPLRLKPGKADDRRIKLGVQYLAKVDGRWHVGSFGRQWYGLYWAAVYPSGFQLEHLSQETDVIFEIGAQLVQAEAEVERLKERIEHMNIAHAELVAQAEAEVERLKNSVSIPASAEQLNNQRDQIRQLTNRAMKAEADLARVREALEELEAAVRDALHDLPDKGADAQATLRAALEGRVNNPHMNSSEDK